MSNIELRENNDNFLIGGQPNCHLASGLCQDVFVQMWSGKALRIFHEGHTTGGLQARLQRGTYREESCWRSAWEKDCSSQRSEEGNGRLGEEIPSNCFVTSDKDKRLTEFVVKSQT